MEGYKMKKLFLSAILSVGLISSAIAMESQDLKITRNRIDFENSQFIEFSDLIGDRKSTRLNSSHSAKSRMPSSA